MGQCDVRDTRCSHPLFHEAPISQLFNWWIILAPCRMRNREQEGLWCRDGHVERIESFHKCATKLNRAYLDGNLSDCASQREVVLWSHQEAGCGNMKAESRPCGRAESEAPRPGPAVRPGPDLCPLRLDPQDLLTQELQIGVRSGVGL